MNTRLIVKKKWLAVCGVFFFIPLLLASSVLVPALVMVSADTPGVIPAWIPCNGVVDANPSGGLQASQNHACTFQDLVNGSKAFANEIVQIGLIVAPLILAYVGWLFITSGDNPDNRNTAKKIGWNVVKGLAMMMLAWVVVNLILTALLKPNIVTLN